mmetsp:Transcript_24159/g.48009  ORF Transcript_24159/g.48009 Transcript_24159/m.48009 type:complete len:218 (-) Transcript_24159:62-715(-)
MNQPHSPSPFLSILPFGLEPKTFYDSATQEDIIDSAAPENHLEKDTSDKIVSAKYPLFEGRCHCGAVQFEISVPPSSLSSDGTKLILWDCNCTICTMKRNVHLIVPENCLRLKGAGRNKKNNMEIIKETMTTYTYGTCVARHLFCKICGVCPFYIPRSNPDGIAITFHCLQLKQRTDTSLNAGIIDGVEVRRFDGRNWEKDYKDSDIKDHSVSRCDI